MKFVTALLQNGKTATGFEVPASVVEALGKGKRPPVKVTINDHTYRSSVASMDGKFMVGVSAEQREAAGVAAGDDLEVEIELDTEPRTVDVPPDLAEALAQDAAAGQFFEGLSYSNKQRHVLAINGAKTDETRQRRIAKAVSMFREGRS